MLQLYAKSQETWKDQDARYAGLTVVNLDGGLNFTKPTAFVGGQTFDKPVRYLPGPARASKLSEKRLRPLGSEAGWYN